MQYPEEFKQNVLSIFGDNKKMREMLDKGVEAVGWYLDNARYDSVSSKEIIEACESLNFQGIYQKAQRQIAIEKLYLQWAELFNNPREKEMSR